MYNERRVDPEALAQNYRTVCDLARGRSVIAVLKANAYGHGAAACGRVLASLGCMRFAVASLGEALELSRALPAACEILILSPTPPKEIPQAAACRFVQSIPSLSYAAAVDAVLQGRGLPLLSVHLKLDAGMHRLGFPVDAAGIREAVTAANLPCLHPVGIYGHLSSADVPESIETARQIDRFSAGAAALSKAGIQAQTVHLTAGDGLLLCPPVCSAVRAGLPLYGYSAVLGDRFCPVMSLTTRIVQLRCLAAGEAVGYGGSAVTARPTRLGILPLGYADGLCRCLSPGGSVFVAGGSAPFFGRICMDLATVDLTDLPEAGEGDMVTVFDRFHPITRLCAAANTVPYELLCSFSHARAVQK